MDGELNEYLHDVDEQCNARLDILMEQMQALAGITEELKAVDQMKCVRLMNNVKVSAEEIVLNGLVY
jgi:hypothetical protein